MERIKSLFDYSKYSFIAQIADHLRFKVDSFVIAGFLNLTYVTHYFIGLRLVEYFMQFIISALGVMRPVYSQYEGKGDFESIKNLFLGVTRISVILSFFLGSSIIFYGKAFIQRWMGSGYESSYYVLIILCSASVLDLMQNPSVGLLYGISKHRYYSIANTLEGILNLVLSLILVRYYGMYGVAMGTFVGMFIFRLFIQPFYICAAINLSVYEYYFKTIFLSAIKTIVSLAAYFYLVKEFFSPNYVSIIILFALQITLFAPIAFLFILSKRERQYIKGFFGITQNKDAVRLSDVDHSLPNLRA